jgi:hypothetical protein
MKKIFIALLLSVFVASNAFAVAPTIEEKNYIQFTAADQETSTTFKIYSIVWISAAGAEIAATHGFLLEDASGAVIAGGEATAVSDQVIITIPNGIYAAGLKAEDLDGGYLYVYGVKK